MKRTTNYKCKAWHSWGGLSWRAPPHPTSPPPSPPPPTRREARSPEWVKANFVLMSHVHVYTGNNVVTGRVHTSRDQSSRWPFILWPSSLWIRPLTMVSTIQLCWWMTCQKQDCKPTQRNSKLDPPTGSQGAGNLWPMRDDWFSWVYQLHHIQESHLIWFWRDYPVPSKSSIMNGFEEKHIIWWGLK